MGPNSLRTRACIAALAIGVAVPAGAQDTPPGGRALSFGTTLGLVISDNGDFDVDGASRTDATLGFSLGAISATPTRTLDLSADFGLRASAGGDDDTDTTELFDPRLALGYRQRSRSAELRFDASLRRTEVSSLTPLDLVLDDIIDLEDVEEIQDALDADREEDITRLSYSARVSLETRRDAPLGVTYSLGVSGVRYSEEIGSLDDEQRVTAGLRIRADLNDVTRATADLSHVTYDTDQDDRTRLDLAVDRRFATASLGARLGFVSDDDRLRSSLSLTGALSRPLGQFSGSLGVSRSDGGDLALIGSARVAYDLPQSDLRFDLTRRVTQIDGDDDDDIAEERSLTSLSSTYTRNLTRLWRLGLNARYTRTETLSTDATDTFGELGVTLSRPITRDWSLNMGLRHRFETDDGAEDKTANSLSLTLSRSIRTPF